MALAGAALVPPAGEADQNRAREVVARALEVMGGAAAIESAEFWTVEGRGRENLSAENQGLAPGGTTWRRHEERVAVDARALRVAWERKTPRVDQSLRWRRFVWSADSSGFYDWNTHRGRMRAAASPERDRLAKARRVPHLLLLEVAKNASRLEWKGERLIGKEFCEVIAAEFPGGDRVELRLERERGLLAGAAYRAFLPGFGDVEVSWEWDRWVGDARLGLVPKTHRVRVEGVVFQEVEYSRYSNDSTHAASVLAIPPNVPSTAMPAAAAGAEALADTGEVAPGVHVIEVGGFVVMFVEFQDFVVAVEAPEHHPGLESIPAARDTGRVTAAFVAAIARRAPGKPIRYVVVSHHHSDHMGGLAEFAAAGATILVSPGHERAAHDAVRTGARARGVGGLIAARVETVAGVREIADSTRVLEVVSAGANPHTDENLFVWLPEERIVFQGDLFYFQRGGAFPPPGRETMNRWFARWLRDHRFEPRAIYGVHNDGPAGPREIAASLK